MKRLSYIFLFFLIFNKIFAQDILQYKNPDLPVNQRVEDLLKRMTIEEKFWQLFMIPANKDLEQNKLSTGIFGFEMSVFGDSKILEQNKYFSDSISAYKVAKYINELQDFYVNKTRLGIPIIPFDESLHGLIHADATAFPQSIGLAATFDTVLMHSVSRAIANETKLHGIRQVLSPVINIARDVRWGRTEETYGEDPYLTSQMAYSYISEFSKLGIIATPKHFAANVGDGGRDSYPIHYSERILEEIYFPAFRSSIFAGAKSIMSSYNSLDGSPCSANNWLLNKKLKQEWNFRGFVISDANSVGGANVLHFTASDYCDATVKAIGNGLDVIFQTEFNHAPLFFDAFKKGLIDISLIDSAVARVLTAKFELGLFENPYVNYIDKFEKNKIINENKNIAYRAAQESIVLLKNEHDVLPVSQNIKNIAVIGFDATEARLGGYSRIDGDKISILDGLKNAANNDINIFYSEGCGENDEQYKIISSKYLKPIDNKENENGLKASYFDNISLKGKPIVERIDKEINFNWTLSSSDSKLENNWYSVRWKGYLIPDSSGICKIGIEANDGFRLYINDSLLIDNWKKQSYSQILKEYYFVKNEHYSICIEYFECIGNAKFKLIWNSGTKNTIDFAIQEAVNVVKKSDIAIVVCGINEGEFQDRSSLKLPGRQEEMINEIAKTGKPVIVVLVGGSAIVMNHWIENVQSIVDVWYPGECGGKAVADVLFGKYNPAGRLPISFPVSEGQLPLYYNHKPTGRGDDYIDLTGKPLFPFGFGLSYTKFEYSDLQFNKTKFSNNDSVFISFKISNIGNYSGDEVCQLYVRDLIATVSQPVLQLADFKRIYIEKNETKNISFTIPAEKLKIFDLNMKKVIEPGDFLIMIGSSSADIRLQGKITFE